MDYKIEIVNNKNIVYSKIYRGYTHPSQIIRLAFKEMPKKYEYVSLFIINNKGEMWYYISEKKEGKYKVLPMGHSVGGKIEINMTFSGNKSIAEVM